MQFSCPLRKRLLEKYDLTRLFFFALMAGVLIIFTFFVIVAFIPGIFCCEYDGQLDQIAIRAVSNEMPTVGGARIETGFKERVGHTVFVQVTVEGTSTDGTRYVAHYLVGIDRTTGNVSEIRRVPG